MRPRKVIAENTKSSKITLDLSDSDLEDVAGGSAGSWLNKNKDWLIPQTLVSKEF